MLPLLVNQALCSLDQPNVCETGCSKAVGLPSSRCWLAAASCGDMLGQAAALTGGPDALQPGIGWHLLCLSLCCVLQGHTLKDSDGFTGFERFMCGLLAGTLAKLGTHPLDVAKKRYQVAGLQRDLRWAWCGCTGWLKGVI